MKTNLSKNFNLIDAGNEIFYCDNLNKILPKKLLINNKVHYRFCDFIYIPDGTEYLTDRQVRTVNKIREKYIFSHPQYKVNKEIHNCFLGLVKFWRPKTILEVGPGKNPLITNPTNGINKIYLADLRFRNKEINNGNCISRLRFCTNDNLNINNFSIDCIFAIYVFHFWISKTQINEFYRVLSQDGILLANVYRRSKKSKDTLSSDFKDIGFNLTKVPFFIPNHNNNEFWFISKKTKNAKINKSIDIINQFKFV